jgi:hypothetical protein
MAAVCNSCPAGPYDKKQFRAGASAISGYYDEVGVFSKQVIKTRHAVERPDHIELGLSEL